MKQIYNEILIGNLDSFLNVFKVTNNIQFFIIVLFIILNYQITNYDLLYIAGLISILLKELAVLLLFLIEPKKKKNIMKWDFKTY